MERSACVEKVRAEQSKAEKGEDDRAELQMSLERGFAAMRVVLKYLTGDTLMDIWMLGLRYCLTFGGQEWHEFNEFVIA